MYLVEMIFIEVYLALISHSIYIETICILSLHYMQYHYISLPFSYHFLPLKIIKLQSYLYIYDSIFNYIAVSS